MLRSKSFNRPNPPPTISPGNPSFSITLRAIFFSANPLVEDFLLYIGLLNIMDHKELILRVESGKKMDEDLLSQTDQRLIKSGDLIVDLPSMEKGFQEEERCRQEIWDYIQYLESLLKWPSIDEKIKMGSSLKNG